MGRHPLPHLLSEALSEALPLCCVSVVCLWCVCGVVCKHIAIRAIVVGWGLW